LLGWGNLRDEPCPFEVPAQELSMVWLSLTDNDPAERWLRTRLEQHMGNLAATAA
jgi:LysR family transcriptional activator of mexEF-oprN operon